MPVTSDTRLAGSGLPRQLDLLGAASKPSADAVASADILTIGHSSRSFAAFVALLQAQAVRHLVDVRSVPYSRRHPQFSRENLRASLAAHAIAYAHFPALGGRRAPSPDAPLAAASPAFRGYVEYMATPPFVQALVALETLAASTRVVFMCAEAAPLDCHRQFIAAALEARGRRVGHIVG